MPKLHYITCKICHKLFTSKYPKAQYCSLDCRGKGHRKYSERACLICNSLFLPTKASSKFCSHACYAESLKTKAPRQCVICDTSFIPKKPTQVCCSGDCYKKSLDQQTKHECMNCHKIFNSRKPNQQYCSRECASESRKEQVELQCARCGKPFQVIPARGKQAKYCSRECLCKKVVKICAFCGGEYTIKVSDASKRLTCSRSCAMKYRTSTGHHPHQGKVRPVETRNRVSAGLKRYYNGDPTKHGNFQNVGTNARRGIHSEWQNARALVRARDNYTCQHCGKPESELGMQLAVHHIIPFRKFTDWREANQFENLVCVCQSCHMKAEHKHKD